MSHRSDPKKIQSIVRLLEGLIPNATIRSRDPGGQQAVEFTIEGKPGTGRLLVDWDRLQEDQEETESYIRQLANRLAAGVSWRLKVDGTVRLLKASDAGTR